MLILCRKYRKSSRTLELIRVAVIWMKCLFDQRELWFYGFLLTDSGIKADPRKVDAIKYAKEPKDTKELRSFLGLANYCSRFIKNFSTLTSPLRELTVAKTPYTWTPRHTAAFAAIKEAIQKDCIMHFYDPNQKTCLTVDASPTGLGAILSNIDRAGNLHIVAYASRSLTLTEQRYSQTERKALAVVWGCERFHMYLIGAEFTICTDHKALEVIYSPKSKPPARIQRWALRLQQYKFNIIYRKGEGNPADLLSRQPLPVVYTEHCDIAEQYINFIEKNTIPKAMSIESIIAATAVDPEMQSAIESIQSGVWAKHHPFYAVREELAVTPNSLLLRAAKLIIPTRLRNGTMTHAHKGHQGIVKTKQALRLKVWWPQIDKDAEEFIKHCHACQSLGHGDSPPPLQQHKLPSKPWDRLHMDFCGPFPTRETLFVVIDSYSKFPEVEIMKSTTASAVTNRLDRIFAVHGIPTDIYSDNGPPFASDAVKKFMQNRGINHRLVTPYWPQANREAESFMKPLGKAVKAAKMEGKDWKEELHGFLLAYKTTPHCTTGVAPSQLLFNREVRTNMPTFVKEGDIDYKILHEQAKINTSEKQLKAQQYTDKRQRARKANIEVGMKVLVKQEHKNKFSTVFDPTPLTVTKVNGTKITAERHDLTTTRNVLHFKRFYSKNESAEQECDDSASDVTDDENNNEQPQDIPRRYPARVRRRPRFLREET